MNYGFVSALILIISLLIALITYEKRNTSVKEIALLATLSGLAGVSRVPFVALPSVQPTTFFSYNIGICFWSWFWFYGRGSCYSSIQ